MTIQPLDALTLHDLSARFPFFSTLPFAGEEQSAHPASPLSRQVAASAAINPTHLKFVDIPSPDRSRRDGLVPTAGDIQARPRYASFPLAGQNVPSSNSITLIAGLTERQVTPPRSIAALYERTARPAPTLPTVALG